jgi:retron-type reverse transcriptase
MGLFSWLFGKKKEPPAKPAAPAAPPGLPPELLQHIQQILQMMGGLSGQGTEPPATPGAPTGVPPHLLLNIQQMAQMMLGGWEEGWHYERNQQIVGPLSLTQLQQLSAAGQLQATDIVWRENGPRVPLSSALLLGGILARSRIAAAPVAPSGPVMPSTRGPDAPEWYFTLENKDRKGPFSLTQLEWMVRSNIVHPNTMVWRPGLPAWVTLSSVPRMTFAPRSTPPPLDLVFAPPVPVGPSPGQMPQNVEWYYSTDRKRQSTITSLADIQGQARVGRIQPDAVAWRYGLPAWVPVTLLQGVTFPTTSAAAPASQQRASAPRQPAPPSLPQGPRRDKTLNLDAGAFLPISQSELKSQAKNIDRGAWFGRRDLIPPADDPRTKLIDRALVTNGLLSPEQLAEIHTVGAEMERVRPALENIETRAYRSGEEAVQAERAQKARLKEQKKADAERRKKERAEAVAHRKATDIIFLGRGVSKRLHDRVSNVEKLRALGLPVLSTPADLAGVLGLRVPRLRWLAFHTEVASRIHYVQFTVPKRSGGQRTLSAPHKALANAQQWILENIVSKLPAEPAAHGFVAGKSILTNAREHVARDVVISVDLEDFFPSITFPRVRSVFQRAGYSGAIATILALLCTECPRRTVQYDGKTYHVAIGPRGLPQGACTSPGLSNQVARRLDRRLTGLAKKFGLSYTRYADDLTCSGPLPLPVRSRDAAPETPEAAGKKQRQGVGYLLARLRHIAEAEGFCINEKKSRVLRRGAAQRVTGLVVNVKPSLPRRELRRLRAILHRARKEGLEAQNREHRPNFRAWLEGKIAYVSMVRPDLGAKLKADLSKI